jgi:hypothetical protein
MPRRLIEGLLHFNDAEILEGICMGLGKSTGTCPRARFREGPCVPAGRLVRLPAREAL